MASGMPDLEQRYRALKPRMAHRFPFELDTFQKEAIVHLEQVPPCSAIDCEAPSRVQGPVGQFVVWLHT
jgi:hypothetical protein